MNNKVGGALSIVSGASAVVGEVSMEGTLRVVGLIVAIVSGILSIAFTACKWYKQAKADGKITLEEVGQGIQEVASQVEEVKDNIQKEEKKNG